MNLTAMFIAALILIPAVALGAWAWFATAQVEEALLSVSGFEGRDFEVGPRAPVDTEGTTWPIPG
jgi:hypothetical protein